MSRISKNIKKGLESYKTDDFYSLKNASELIKKISFAKVEASVDMDIRLGVDPKKADQMVRGVVVLPHGNGKKNKVLVLCNPDKEEESKSSGADLVGLDEYIKKIEGGWTDFDIIITQPSLMPTLGKLGKFLGPRGLMPNPKSGTVTDDLAKAIKEVKGGKIDYKVDKNGIIHSSIAKVSFSPIKIEENASKLIDSILKLKPASTKGTYFKSISISSTMSSSIRIDKSIVNNL